MIDIKNNISIIKQKILEVEHLAQRKPNSVSLLAVSKKQTIEAIFAAFHAGVFKFGESYLQEALPKIDALSSLSIEWHYIGRIQRNKVKLIARNFSWAHAISSFIVAEGLSVARSQELPKLNVCIQLNIDDENSKAGISMDEAFTLAEQIKDLPGLALRGLMVIPKPELRIEKQISTFEQVRECMLRINQKLALSLDTLSMGMSADFEAAIMAGSTIVRIGTGIFGERN